MTSARCYDHIGLAEQIMTLLIIVRNTTGRRFALRLFQDLLLEITAKVGAHFEHTLFKNRTTDEISRIGGLNWRGERRIFRMPMSISQSGKVSKKWYPAIVQFQTRVDVNGEVGGLCYLYVHTLKRKASENIIFMFQGFGIIEVEFVGC